MFQGKKNILYLLIFVLLVENRMYAVQQNPNSFSQPTRDTVLPDSIQNVVKISRSWELPSSLRNISGIDFVDDHRLACIQDETGSIFIYNLKSASIESEIAFATPGDYEGITLVNKNAYVASADGRILEITNYRSSKRSVKEYGTHLTVKQNVEGLCYDKRNRRLLVVIKGQEESNQFYKGIYAFDLATKKMLVKPVFQIDLQDSVLNKGHSKKFQSLILPSDIAIHPRTGEIYITDAIKSQVLILDKTGDVRSLYHFDRSKTIQPEGIRITPSGELYIASEGFKEEPGMLMRILLIER